MTNYHVAIGYAGKVVDFTEIQKLFGSAGWARYAPNCWIVRTNESAETLVDRIRKKVSQEDSIFICEVNLQNTSGYLQKEIWDWIKSNKA